MPALLVNLTVVLEEARGCPGQKPKLNSRKLGNSVAEAVVVSVDFGRESPGSALAESDKLKSNAIDIKQQKNATIGLLFLIIKFIK